MLGRRSGCASKALQIRVYDDAGNVIEAHDTRGISRSGEGTKLLHSSEVYDRTACPIFLLIHLLSDLQHTDNRGSHEAVNYRIRDRVPCRVPNLQRWTQRSRASPFTGLAKVQASRQLGTVNGCANRIVLSIQRKFSTAAKLSFLMRHVWPSTPDRL